MYYNFVKYALMKLKKEYAVFLREWKLCYVCTNHRQIDVVISFRIYSKEVIYTKI